MLKAPCITHREDDAWMCAGHPDPSKANWGGQGDGRLIGVGESGEGGACEWIGPGRDGWDWLGRLHPNPRPCLVGPT